MALYFQFTPLYGRYLPCTDIAAKYAIDTFKKIASKYHTYSVPLDPYGGYYGYGIMKYLAYVAGQTSAPTETVDIGTVFDDVKKNVCFDVAHGVLTDVIGSDFDLDTSASCPFTLSVGGKSLTGIASGSNTWSFDDGNYVITYTPGSDEQFAVAINTPIHEDAQLTISYTLKLVNKETAPGTNVVPTNESAVLDYEDSDDNDGSFTFSVPTVKYTVIGELPKTGDNTPLLLLASAALVSLLGLVLLKRKHA